jgi:hypothetical protein
MPSWREKLMWRFGSQVLTNIDMIVGGGLSFELARRICHDFKTRRSLS